MIVFVGDKQLWTLKVSRRHSHIVVFFWQVELPKSPIDNSQFSVFMVDNNILRLDVSVHDAFGVAIMKPFQYFIDVELAIKGS